MHVLLLGDPAKALIPTLEAKDDSYDLETGIIESSVFAGFDYDFLISYGYRHKLRHATLSSYPKRAINLHTSYLPWNRGAHPNFWSWIDNTPKGVTMHLMDDGIDTGPIIARRQIELSKSMTFAESYDALAAAAVQLFADAWPLIRVGDFAAEPQDAIAGSAHRVKDLRSDYLPNGWDTRIADALVLRDAAIMAA